jgi:hypothetical protein
MNVIKSEEYLAGIKYWAQFYVHLMPRFEVFKYVGRSLDTGTYYFQSLRTGNIVGRSYYSLNNHGFKPFCLDTERIRKIMGEESSNANL